VTKIHDYIKHRASPPVKLFSLTVEYAGKLFIVLQIPEFEDQPHICTKDATTASQKDVFRRGDLLARTVGATSERLADDSAVRQLLNLAVQRRADSMLADVARIMRGERGRQASESPFWLQARSIAEAYAPNAGEFQSLGCWRFSVAPATPLALPADQPPFAALQPAAVGAQVELRGWDFPHLKPDDVEQRRDATSGLAYLLHRTNWHHHVEVFTLFENGYAQLDCLMVEDLEARELFSDKEPTPPGRYFNWVIAIHLVSEFLLFVTRLYAKLSYEGGVRYEVRITAAANRVLRSRTPGRELRHPRKPSAEDEILVRGDIDTAVLRADVPREAVRLLKEIFAMFHWNDPNEKVLTDEIQKLFTRRLLE
jgi:hypothetical protein